MHGVAFLQLSSSALVAAAATIRSGPTNFWCRIPLIMASAIVPLPTNASCAWFSMFLPPFILDMDSVTANSILVDRRREQLPCHMSSAILAVQVRCLWSPQGCDHCKAPSMSVLGAVREELVRTAMSAQPLCSICCTPLRCNCQRTAPGRSRCTVLSGSVEQARVRPGYSLGLRDDLRPHLITTGANGRPTPAIRLSGGSEYALHGATAFWTTPATQPRQPAWARPIAFRCGSYRTTGTQSAKATTKRYPARR